MNTWTAFAMGEANRGKELMVFDWDRAARLIRERKPERASAGLRSDWEYTGGTIYKDEKPVMNDYTYLASTWAVPELDMDGDIVECFRMEHEVPGWNSKTKWPKSALDILNAKSITQEEAIKQIEKLKSYCEYMADSDESGAYLFDLDGQALDLALSALRPITREQMENVWKGKWEPGNPICPICGKDKFDKLDADIWADWMPNFCPHCGAPMTDEAVEMMMERMEALKDE